MILKSHYVAKNIVAFVILVLWSTFGMERSHSAEPGKKEGKVILYTMMNAKDNDVMSRSFEKKYPGIIVEGYRGGPEALVNKVLTEARAGALKADVVFGGGSELQIFKKAGLLAPYVSSETRGSPGSLQGSRRLLDDRPFTGNGNCIQHKPNTSQRFTEDLRGSIEAGIQRQDDDGTV